jgi:hypothetical protein
MWLTVSSFSRCFKVSMQVTETQNAHKPEAIFTTPPEHTNRTPLYMTINTFFTSRSIIESNFYLSPVSLMAGLTTISNDKQYEDLDRGNAPSRAVTNMQTLIQPSSAQYQPSVVMYKVDPIPASVRLYIYSLIPPSYSRLRRTTPR